LARNVLAASGRAWLQGTAPDPSRLDRVVQPFVAHPSLSEAELRLAEAQLAGWLGGLFQAMQASALAQHTAQLQAGQRGQPEQSPPERRGGSYL
jgi:hypothetical protein